MSNGARFSTFSSVLLALIVFFVVLPIGSCVACVMCAGFKSGWDEARERNAAFADSGRR